MACNFELQISNILPRCSFRHLKQVHALIITSSLTQNIQVFSKFLRRSTEFGTMDYSSLVFSQMGNDLGTEIMLWNAMIRGYAFNGPPENCIYLFDHMRRRGLKPHNFTYPYVLNSCRELRWHWKGKSVHCQIIKSGFESSDQVATSLFNMYMKVSSFLDDRKRNDAHKVFDDMYIRPIEAWNILISEYVNAGDMVSAKQLFELMPIRDVVSWNSMISGYAKAGKLESAKKLFEMVPEKNVVSWNSMISGYMKAGKLANARKLFEMMPEKNVISWTSMIGAHADAGDIDNARRIFEEMPCKNLVSWNSMISSYARHGKNAEALDLFVRLLSASVIPDGYTFVSVLSACANLGALDFGKYVHGLIENLTSLEVMVGTALIGMYAKCGVVDRAFAVFVKVKKDAFCWNVMIRSLAIHGRTEDALNVFFVMQKTRWKPTAFTFLSALFACSHGGLVEEGCRIFYSMEADYKICPKIEHYGCLIDLLSRNGQLEVALHVVENMPFKPDVAIWGALLGGYRGTSDLKLAEGIIDRVIELGTNESGVYALLSNIHALEGQWPEARAAREKMEELSLQKKAGSSSSIV